MDNLRRKAIEIKSLLNLGSSMVGVKLIYLFPLEQADIEPDVVVVEDETEKLMWIALAQLNAQVGKRVTSSTAILQTTCVDATIIPYIEQKLDLSFGCYGCREAIELGKKIKQRMIEDIYKQAGKLTEKSVK